MNAPVGLPAIVEYLNAWAPVVGGHANARVIRYEDMRARPAEQLASVVDFLAAPFSKEEVAEAVEFGAFENLKELERVNFFKNSRLTPKNPNDPDSFKVRRGKVGGYSDYFDDEQIAAMESLVRSGLDPVFGYGG